MTLTFEELFGELRELGGGRGGDEDVPNSAEVEAAAKAIADLPRVDSTSLSRLIAAHPNWVPLLASCVGLGLEQLKRQLRYRLGTAGWTNLARQKPDLLIATLDEAFGLVRSIEDQRSRRWSFGDILLERHRWSRRRASSSVRRGRRLEHVAKEVAIGLGLPYVMRTRFVGLGGREAPCDFAIPRDGSDALIVGVVKGFNSTGSKRSAAVREIEEIASTRLPRQFVFAFVDGIGWLGRRSDLRRIFDLWANRAIDGLYSLSRIDTFRSDLSSAARRVGLL